MKTRKIVAADRRSLAHLSGGAFAQTSGARNSYAATGSRTRTVR